MAIPNRPLGQTKYSVQNMGNASFDETFSINAVEGLVYNPVTQTLDRAVQSGQTLPTSGNNASLVLAYDGSGNLTTITKTIGATSYIKTLTYDGSGNLTNVSVWV